MSLDGSGSVARSTPIGLVRDLGNVTLDNAAIDPEEAPQAAPRLPRVGDVIDGKYRLERRVGDGGMGVVFAGVHLLLQTPIALKCLRPELQGDSSALVRFLQEARLAASILHENSTRIYDVGTTDDGVPFIVMEYLEGESLDARLEHTGPLPVATAVTVVLQTLSVLAEAHAKGLVHRDLKPANLFLQSRADGLLWVKVMDFGISKPVDSSALDMKLTAPRSLLGSPQYMSPEQLRDSSTVDQRSDIWSMGIVLYELLTGRPPFDAPSLVELCARILDQEPPSLRRARGDVPPGLEDVVRAMLAKDPDARPRSVGQVALLLAPFAPDDARASAARINAVCLKAELARSESGRIVVEPRRRSWLERVHPTAIGVALVAMVGTVAYALASKPAPIGPSSPTLASLPNVAVSVTATAQPEPVPSGSSAPATSAAPSTSTSPSAATTLATARPKPGIPSSATSGPPRIRRPSQIQPLE